MTSVWFGVPEEAASVVVSARLGYKSNAPHLTSTLQLAQPQLAGRATRREEGRNETGCGTGRSAQKKEDGSEKSCFGKVVK